MGMKPKNFAAAVAKLETTPAAIDNAVKVTPGHGVAGRRRLRRWCLCGLSLIAPMRIVHGQWSSNC